MSDSGQVFDVFHDSVPGIMFAAAGDMWTILTGVLVSASHSDGVLGNKDSQSLVNLGSVLGGGGAAVEMDGGNSSVSNAAGAEMIGAIDGLIVDGFTASVDNHGSILGLSNIGVDLDGDSAKVALDNAGSIFGREIGVTDFSQLAGAGADIHNTGVIASDGFAVDVGTEAGIVTRITNAAGAVIRGGDAAIFVVNGGIALTNLGRIVGGVVSDGGDDLRDVVVNHGKIIGAVDMSGGDDIYNGTGGTAAAVFGGNGDDRLVGGAAADVLDGGFGEDTLIGHGGADRFEFDTGLAPFANVDTIGDFTPGIDRIVLDHGVFDRIGQPGVLAAARFHVGAAAADAGDRIIYNANSGFVYYDPDGKGGAAELHFATLTPHLDLHASDFLVALLAA